MVEELTRHFNSTYILAWSGIGGCSELGNQKTSTSANWIMATTPTGWLTTGSKLDCIQKLVRINSFHTWRLISLNKLYDSKTQKTNYKWLHTEFWWFNKTKEFKMSIQRWTKDHPEIPLAETWPLVKLLQKTCSVSNGWRQHKKPLHSVFFSKKETTACASDATKAVATNITQIGLPVVRTELLNWNRSLSVLAICDTEPSISFVDKSIVSTVYLQSGKASVSVVRIHLSQYFKTEMAPTMISALKKFSPLTTVQTCVHEKLKLDDQIVDL